MKEKIINYLISTYKPTSILLYGSYSNGTNNLNSDFDCLLVVENNSKHHDESIIEGVQLDCFIYSKKEIEEKEIEEFTNLFDAEIVLDDGYGKDLKEKVLSYIEENKSSSQEDKYFVRKWIIKMMERLKRNDDESKFRGIMMVDESLQDYYMFRDLYYFGPKKAIIYLKENDKAGYELFHKCMEELNSKNIEAWMNHVISY